MTVLRNVATPSNGILLPSALTSPAGVADTETTLITINDEAVLKQWENLGVPVFRVRGDGRIWLRVLSAQPAVRVTGDIWLETVAGVTVLRYQAASGPTTVLSDVSGLQVTTAGAVLAGHAVRASASGVVHAAAVVDSNFQYRVLGLAAVDTLSGNTVEVFTNGDNMALADWSLITGTTSLTPGAYYYLSATPGRFTTTPDPAVLVRVGVAADAQTLVVEVGFVVLP